MQACHREQGRVTHRRASESASLPSSTHGTSSESSPKLRKTSPAAEGMKGQPANAATRLCGRTPPGRATQALPPPGGMSWSADHSNSHVQRQFLSSSFDVIGPSWLPVQFWPFGHYCTGRLISDILSRISAAKNATYARHSDFDLIFTF